MLFALAASSATVASGAWATDGVLEINQTCAIRTGCFSGDTPGYPVTIVGSEGRSYRLTSDLVVADENTTGIIVSAPNTSIDLNGFEIVRSACVGATTDCTPAAGGGSGISMGVAPKPEGLSVRNGAITGMGVYGVRLGDRSEVRNLHLRWNGDRGVFLGNGSSVSGCTAYQNGGDGIEVGDGSWLSGNTSYQNGGTGIDAGRGSTISGNAVYRNAGTGILVGEGATVSTNSSHGNGSSGIFSAAATAILDNAVYSNGSRGIIATGSATVQRNALRSNTGFGLELVDDFISGEKVGYRGNVITNNTVGTVTGGVDMGANSCNGTMACP